MMDLIKTSLGTLTATGNGDAVQGVPGQHLASVAVSGAGSVSATGVIQGSNDLNAPWKDIGSYSISGTGSAAGTVSWSVDYLYWRLVTASITGSKVSAVVSSEPSEVAGGLSLVLSKDGRTQVLNDATHKAIADSGFSVSKFPGVLTRLSDAPIYSSSMERSGFGLGAVYWPWVVPAYKYLANPLAKYYLYYSTDHSTWGGIGLALSDSPTGPFVQYTPPGPSTQDASCPGTYTNGHANQAGAVYMDAQAGSTTPNTVWGTPGAAPTAGTINYMQCETPSVIWDEQIGMFRMFYQVGSVNGRAVFSRPADPTATPSLYETFYSATGAQSTLSATSPDGVAWTKDRNFIIQPIWQSHSPGDGHSGYFLPSRYAGHWSAYHLWGSTNYARFALSRASGYGASDWQTDNRELGPWAHICGLSSSSAAMGINWNNMHLIEGRDGPIGIGTISEFVSGGSARESALIVVPMSRDLRKPLCRPSIASFVSGALPWESTDLKGISVMQDGGKTYVYYGCKTSGGTYNVGVMQYV